MQSELVSQAVVLAREDGEGRRRLVGYVVADGLFNKEGISSYLHEKLPDYMVPGGWVRLESLPLTPNGKIDKKALPDVDQEDLVSNEYIAPRNETEEKLAIIWQELLHLNRVGIYDNFFELGGHSLLAMRVVSAIRKELEAEIAVKDLFVHPTVAELSRQLEAQSAELLPSIKVQSRPQYIPLSFSQERLWFVDQLEGSVEYHSPAVIRLKGSLNREALEYALKTIVGRHEVLRTVFAEQEGRPYQVIRSADDWKLTFFNGSGYKDDHKRLDDIIEKIIKEPFDLSKDYMLRADLITLDEQEHILVVTMHHIASDEWSVSIIVKEVVELYSSFEEGREMQLEPLELQYADYAIWQRSYLHPQVLDERVGYWKDKLQGVAPLELPADNIRPAVRSTKGASAVFVIDKVLSGQLKELSRQQGTTLFMTLLAVYKVLLHRYSGQEDISVGTSISNRPQKELEGLIGFFVNTLALRDEVNGNASFTDLLQQVRATTLEAYEHQDVPFEKVVEAVVKERDAGRSPLFQVMLVLRNTPQATQLHFGDVVLLNGNYEHTISKFDITFFITETPDGLHGLLEYSTGLFGKRTIDRMIVHFQQLLAAVVKEPHQRIGLLPILPQGEEHQLLVEFNNSFVSYPGDKSIAALFEDQAAKTPEGIAVVSGHEQVSYRELNERSNRLAHYLRSRGVRENSLVPLYIERSEEMMVGILGILKAGGAYVPIDTDFPEERIRYMLEDTGASVVVSSTGSRSGLSFAEDIDIIELNGDEAMLSLYGAVNPVEAGSDNLAYVIYTSGSTGKPKGVMIEHRSLSDYVFGIRQSLQTEQCRSFALVSTIATDLGNTVIYSSLLTGGTLHLFSKEAVSDAEYLNNYFKEHTIDCLKIVPSHWKALCTGDKLLLPQRLLIFGGEALQAEVNEAIRLSGSSCTVVNHYGPTETTIGKLLYVIKRDKRYNNTIPVGKPFSNTQVYVLSKELQLCPVGVPGQLYIGGDGLARGYVNNSDLTNEKFIQNPFEKQAGSVIYGTGDLVKYLPDGNIAFIGRTDNQVKIRGYRIEPGEIESVLQQCELVDHAAVMAREDKQGNKRLVAYVVPQGWFDREGILSYIKANLPEYMVPALLVELDSMPLTPNGKIDRKALPDPDVTELLSKQYVAPRNESEAKLAEIWQEVLEEDRIGIHDDFFELGGHSLLAVRLISAIRKAFSVEMPVSSIFDYSTIALLSEQLQSYSGAPVLPSIEAVDPRPEQIPLSFSQERLWFIDRLEGSVQYHIPAVLRLKGRLNKDALAFALQSIVNRHEVLRTVIREEEGQAYQYIKDKDQWQLAVVDNLIYKEDPKGLYFYIQQLINKPFDLSKDHMIRADLVILSEQEHLLAITLHHIASDGWSTSVMVKEVAELYSSFEESRPAQLAPLQIQYADYAIWQRRYLEGEILDNKTGYWKEKLQGVAPLQLPSDYNRPAVQSTRGNIKEFSIDKELSEQLQLLSQQQNTTLFMTLLAAFKVLLYRYSGQQDICVGTPIAGRQQHEVENLIGFFVNTLALRSDVNGNALFTELLQQVKTTTMGAYAHQEVPFEKVVETVVKERDISRSPLFQVMFVLQNTPPIPKLQLGEVTLSGEDFDHTTSPFDITLYVKETSIGLQGFMQYCTDLYAEETIERMLGHFKELLRSVVREPQQRIGTLQMLTHAEQHQLLEEFNDTKAGYRTDKSVADLFEEQAAKTPQATAVIFKDQQISYQQLNEQANRLAHYIRSKGVKQETLVPICIERSTEMIVAILAILKAGAAYVPIDPQYPPERIQFMLKDIKAEIILTNKELASSVGLNAAFEVVDANEYSDGEKLSSENLIRDFSPDNLVCIIYTSGSLGKPKGVKLTQKGILNRMHWMWNTYPFKDNERGALKTSIGFVDHLWEMFGPLLKGIPAVLFSKDDMLDLDILLEKLSSKEITRLVLVPSLLSALLSRLKTERVNLKCLKYWICSGEALTNDLTEDFYKLFPKFSHKLLNIYGSSEVTADVTCYDTSLELMNETYNKTSEYKGQLKDTKRNVSIGKPISNCRIYIKDENGNLVPKGVTGELYAAGVQVAQGYLGMIDLTAEKFVIDTFYKESGAKMYKTGDLGRWLSDGNIEYLGRKDDQVKIRGYRIEPGEIESVLRQSDLVKEVAIVSKKDKQGSNRLIGYIVANNLFSKEAIIMYLQEKLPEYMVPSFFVELNTMPLTPNGKIDKKALPEPEAGELKKEYVAPRNKQEELLAQIWQNQLHIERVGIEDDFFELGGHSLLAMRVISIIHKQLKVVVTIKDLFVYPTIAKLSMLFHSYEKEESSATVINNKSLVPVKTQGTKIPLYIVSGAGGTAFTFKDFADMLDTEQPVYVLQQPEDKKGLLEFSTNVQTIAATYITEILTQNPDGPYAISGHCIGGIIAFEMSKQLEAMGKNVVLLAMFDTIIRKKEKFEQPAVKNLFNIPKKIKWSLFKLVLKIDFEIFLLRKHTKHAIQYKVDSLKYLINKVNNNIGSQKQEDEGLEVFDEISKVYKTASINYQLTPYNGDLVVFYAKDHYYFVDKNRNIAFKKIKFSNETKNIWKEYSKNVTIYEIEGEHSSIFDTVNAKEFAILLQQHLNKSVKPGFNVNFINRKKKLNEQTAGKSE